MQRIKWTQLSARRVFNAITRRVAGIPGRLSYAFSREGMRNRESLHILKNRYKGQTCILLANGPSLASEDLSHTWNYPTFGLNRAYLGSVPMNFKIDYLVCVNDLVLSQFGREIEEVKCTKFLSWQARKIIRETENTFWVNPGLHFGAFSQDITMGLYPAATVTYAALQIIYFMGFKKVVILGMDHNFELNKSTIPNTTETYDHDKDVNHFLPNYFPSGVKWETPDLLSSEHFYSLAREVFERSGRRIVDCTTGGRCQVFEKSVLSKEIGDCQ